MVSSVIPPVKSFFTVTRPLFFSPLLQQHVWGQPLSRQWNEVWQPWQQPPQPWRRKLQRETLLIFDLQGPI